MRIEAFRTANESDAPAIARIVNEAYRPESGVAGWTHESALVAGRRTTPDQVAETLTRPNSVIIVGLKNSEIIACVHVEKEGRNSHFGMLAVKPTLQGAGAGKQILSHAEQYATEVFGSEKFILDVVTSRNELIAYYLRRGYMKTGSIMDYPLSAGAGMPIDPSLKIEGMEKRSSISFEGAYGNSQIVT